MKNIFTVVLTFFALAVFGQTAQEHLQNGIVKHKQQDFKGAIKEYDKALKTDRDLKDAYFNRGTCELAIKNYNSALQDFTKAIELDPKYIKAYYSRATVYASQEKYLESLPDLDKVIELDTNFPNALTLRGQIRAQSGNKSGACEDFTKAKTNGDPQASKYLNQFCGNEQLTGESLVLNWPEKENWKIGNSQENEEMAVIELIHTNEKLDNWTEFGYMSSIKGVTNVPMDKAMNLMFQQTKQNSSKAKLTFIEKNEAVKNPWILFMIEAPNFKNDKKPESQLWYVVQGETSLYTNFRAVKQSSIPDDLKEKWINFFKEGKLVYK
ncbi:tetratricopeptide repeat protein [Adhaeribacter pallidiroseus]|uniref:Non-specific serine/threonine protein kinase n=1 Tax=Adhaeribacter pallidiroseus TaxID=2072847 RepID=A0A369QG61_9BACT|nr:tetratricopeptide repeat protein [Adhaeribacter pallidiroseus]RDC63921.1 Non-specific serine/threonine protein kinase [Adhaeribacter pallidiroseus]